MKSNVRKLLVTTFGRYPQQMVDPLQIEAVTKNTISVALNQARKSRVANRRVKRFENSLARKATVMTRKNIHKQIDFFRIADSLLKEVKSKNLPFRANGYPDLTRFKFLRALPADIEVWPYSKRHQALRKSRTVIVFFEPDTQLYGYLNKLDVVSEELSEYYAVCGFDLSPCGSDDLRLQRMMILLNQLVNAHLLMSGVNVIPTLRTGDVPTFDALVSYPRDIAFALGSLGCARGNVAHNIRNLTTKVFMTEPSELLSYGFLRTEYKAVLDTLQVPFREEPDYRSIRSGRANRKAA